MIKTFSFASTPQLNFGGGKLSLLPSTIKAYGSKTLLVTGARSFTTSSHAQTLFHELQEQGVQYELYTVSSEPAPAMIDNAVKKFHPHAPDCVVAVGGGSVLDAGKAISAMLPLQASVKDYLEGVGTKSHPGTKVPFIAIPTTSGTGSEATKNAVISETGENGYKRSLRHNNFVPDVAIVDPILTVNCPQQTTAATGMDAFTQLLEAYVSTAANPITDAIALEGLQRVARSLARTYHDGTDLKARTDMALASYLSGIALANAGLGLVHGFASPIGGYFNIPHGIICSALMTPCNKITVRKLRAQRTNPEALRKFATVGKLFSRKDNRSDGYHIDSLMDVIRSWTLEMKIPSLAQYGVHPADYQKIIDATDNKNNPVALEKDEMMEVLMMN